MSTFRKKEYSAPVTGSTTGNKLKTHVIVSVTPIIWFVSFGFYSKDDIMDREPGHLPVCVQDAVSSLIWVKVIAVGTSAAGKTCIIKHFCEDKVIKPLIFWLLVETNSLKDSFILCFSLFLTDSVTLHLSKCVVVLDSFYGWNVRPFNSSYFAENKIVHY